MAYVINASDSTTAVPSAIAVPAGCAPTTSPWDHRHTLPVGEATSIRREDFGHGMVFPPKPASPLENQLNALVAGLYHGTLREFAVLQALQAIIAEHMPTTTRILACPTCRRAYGLVRMREGTQLEVVCEGCEAEGR